MSETKEITLSSVRQGQAGWVFGSTPDGLTLGTNKDEFKPSFKAGAYFWAKCEPPVEGKKAWKILDVAPNKEELETKPQPEPKADERKPYSNRDEDRMDTRTAIMQVGEAFTGGKLEANDPLVLGWRIWCYGKMGISVEKTIQEIKSLPREKQTVLKERLKEKAGEDKVT